MTTTSFSMSHRTGRISKIRRGSGDGTTRRQEGPSGLNIQPFPAASSSARSRSYTGPTNFVASSARPA
jgi:hypothetical protein